MLFHKSNSLAPYSTASTVLRGGDGGDVHPLTRLYLEVRRTRSRSVLLSRRLGNSQKMIYQLNGPEVEYGPYKRTK